MGDPIMLYEWIGGRFVPGSAEADTAVGLIGPHVRPFVSEGCRVLDLCCGAGVWSLWAAELGARVEGVDVAAHMIARARSEADERGLDATFVQADVSQRDHGDRRFDVALLMGNSIADLSHAEFETGMERVHRGLVPGGRVLIHYLDGDEYLADARAAGGGVDLEEPERITWTFTEHQPAGRCWVATYINTTTGEQYEYTTYIHTRLSMHAVLEPAFALDRSFPLSERSHLDVWLERGDAETDSGATAVV
jgi:ubiquinone/menaquinone biosynthesis C-methylase UbiE